MDSRSYGALLLVCFIILPCSVLIYKDHHPDLVEFGKTELRFGSIVEIDKGIYAGSRATLRYESEVISGDCLFREYTAVIKRNGTEVIDYVCEETFGGVRNL